MFPNEEHPQENRGGQITKKPLLPEAQGMPLLVFAVRPIWRQRSIFSDRSCLNCLLPDATIKNCILFYLKQDWDPERSYLTFASSRSSPLGKLPNKKNGKMWEFFPSGGPPPLPPVWEWHVCEKKLWFILHFRTLGTFLVFIKMFTFGWYYGL